MEHHGTAWSSMHSNMGVGSHDGRRRAGFEDPRILMQSPIEVEDPELKAVRGGVLSWGGVGALGVRGGQGLRVKGSGFVECLINTHGGVR
eukprot:1533335-Rhodomonas_salina.2